MTDDRTAILHALGDSLPSPQIPPPQNFAPRDNLVRRFMRAAEENGATTERITEDDAIPDAAARRLRALGLSPQAVCTPEWAHLSWRAAGIDAQNRMPKETDNCGITGVVAAAADCGAMSVRGDNRRQLATSLLPPHHIAIVRARIIMPSLADIFAPVRGVYALFCGPSRTADIEQTLTIGIHGPLTVHILIADSSPENAGKKMIG